MIKAQSSFVAPNLQYIIPPIRIKSSTGTRLHFLTEPSLMVWGKQITIKFREIEAVKGWKLLQGSGCGYNAQHMCAHLIHVPAWRLPICSSTCVPVSSHFLKVETWAWINNDDSFTDNYTKIQYIGSQLWWKQRPETCSSLSSANIKHLC